MNTPSDEYWALWPASGGYWRETFESIDPAIQFFVEKRGGEGHKVEVFRYRWDAPDRTLVFASPAGRGV